MSRETKSVRHRLCFLVRVMRTPFSGFLYYFFIFLQLVFQKKIEFRFGEKEGGCERGF